MTPDLSINSKRTVGKRIAANTGLMVGSKTLAAILGLGSLSIAAKTISPIELGTIVFLHAYMLFFSEVATFQSWQSIIRFGTDDVKENNAQKLSNLLNFGVKLDALAALLAFVLSMLVFVGIVNLAQSFPDKYTDRAAFDIITLSKYAVIYCVLLLFKQRGVSIGIFRLFDKFNVLAVRALVQPSFRFIGVMIAASLGAGFKGFFIAWFCGAMAAYIFLPTMAMLELKRRHLLKAVFTARTSLKSPREGIWPFVIKSNIDSTLAAMNMHLPALLVMGVFGSAWVAVYKIAEEAAKLLSEGFKLLDQVIYPELAKLVSLGQAAKIWRLVTRTALMLLGFGLIMAAFVTFAGPDILTVIFSEDYLPAAPLASLLVLAAAFTGIGAPLYPVLYAADKPERAIYARGTGAFIYIVSFFIFSFTIGKMAPGWAAILANASAVLFVLFLARATLKRKVREQNFVNEKTAETIIAPTLNLVGHSPATIWGMPIRQWQERAFKKAGVSQKTSPKTLHFAVGWVLSSALARAFASRDKTALIANETIIGINGVNEPTAIKYIGQKTSALIGSEITPVYPDDLDDGYNKALRKKEPPYALNIDDIDAVEIMKRQFASSYKGITDFVTKWVWPLPAFYVTRLCAALRLTPNMVTTIGLVLMFAALYYFWQGDWLLGFLTGWLMTFLDTVDGKLARTTMTYSSWGNIYDHGIDLIHPPFWYLAWFVGLGGQFVWPDVMSDAMTFTLLAISVGYVVDRIIEGIFIAQHGFHIHVWRPINSALRFVTARRNPNMFIFMIGICLMPWLPEAGKWGFYAVGIWTWLCISFNILVVLAGTFALKPIQSWMDT